MSRQPIIKTQLMQQPHANINNNNYLSAAARELPPNFYWAIPGKLIGMACPTKRRHIENLQNNHNVELVVNLREVATPQQFFTGTQVRNVHIPIKAFGCPTMKQTEQFIDELEAIFKKHRADPDEGADTVMPTVPPDIGSCGEPSESANASANACRGIAVSSSMTVAVNCRGGKGRTGTMMCCYIVYKEGITAYEAIRRIRELSPGSIETRGQEEFIEEFYRLRHISEQQRKKQEERRRRCDDDNDVEEIAVDRDDRLIETKPYVRSLPYAFDPRVNHVHIPTSGASSIPKTRAPRPTYPAREMLLANPELLAKFGRTAA